MKNILKAALAAPSADNSQPWHLTFDGDGLTASYDAARVAGQTFGPWSPATLIAMGALFENLHQASAAAGAGKGPEWLLQEGAEGDFYFSLHLPEGLGAVPEGLALFGRHTNRHPYKPAPPPEDVMAPILALGEGGGRLVNFSDRAAMGHIGRLVREVSEVRFQTRELHEWLARSFRFGRAAEAGDGLDVATLHLPPGGDLFLKFTAKWERMALMNRLGTYRVMALVDAQPLKVAPAIVAVVGGRSRREVADAGRLMERAWIALNAAGLAVHPYYVLSDALNRLEEGSVPPRLTDQVRRVAGEVPGLFGLGEGETVHMLLRVGFPTREPVMARRLPLEAVYTERSGDGVAG